MKLGQHFFDEFDKVNEIGLICYEEAHCDFLFGKLFRKEILDAKSLFQNIRNAVKMSITASPMGGDPDFMAKLSGLSEDYYLSKSGLFKENVTLKVHTASSNKLQELVKVLGNEEKTIIFCHKIETCNQIKTLLEIELMRNFYIYTSKLSSIDKKQVYEDFQKSEKGILICTKSQAFGVNYSNIKSIVIWELPDSLEILYQMTGRAARQRS